VLCVKGMKTKKNKSVITIQLLKLVLTFISVIFFLQFRQPWANELNIFLVG